jgi:hypothetical protein
MKIGSTFRVVFLLYIIGILMDFSLGTDVMFGSDVKFSFAFAAQNEVSMLYVVGAISASLLKAAIVCTILQVIVNALKVIVNALKPRGETTPDNRGGSIAEGKDDIVSHEDYSSRWRGKS